MGRKGTRKAGQKKRKRMRKKHEKTGVYRAITMTWLTRLLFWLVVPTPQGELFNPGRDIYLMVQ